MRTICVIVLLCMGAAATASAQTQAAPSTSSNSPEQATPEGFLPEPKVIRRAVDFAGRWKADGSSPAKDGFYPQLAGPTTGAGWISAGPGYRKQFMGGQLLVDGWAAISWRAYKQVQARVELPKLLDDHLTVGSQARWQDYTQISYFGTGSDSRESLRSEYRLKDTDVLGYGIYRPNDWLAVSGRFGWLRHPTLEAAGGWFDRNFLNTLVVFPRDPGVAAQPDFLHGDAAVTVDTRDEPGHPTRGGYYRAAASVYSDRDFNQNSFRRYEAEGLQLLPLVGKRWVLAFRGWGVFSDTPGGNEVPFYLLPSLGGDTTLRGYHDFRFHDRNLLVASAESRFALLRHLDAAVFVDAGNVASRVADLDLDKRSYGGGFRVHTGQSTLARLDVAHGSEGWRVWFRLQDPFRMKRRSEVSTIVPFVP